jgi:hypothetical protein
VRAFAAWLEQRDRAAGDALVAPRAAGSGPVGRDLLAAITRGAEGQRIVAARGTTTAAEGGPRRA